MTASTFVEPPIIDPSDFRKTLAGYPTGVAVVTAGTDSGPVGMCVGTFTSISLDPPLVGFFPKSTSWTLAELVRSERFCVNVLGADQAHLAQRFSGPAQERFLGLELTEGRTGVPRLADAQMWVDCAVDRVLEIGDHALLVGRVHDLGTREGITAPLIFHRGGYTSVIQD